MKKVAFIMTILVLACCSKMLAQDTTKMLLKFSRPSYVGVYIAPEFQYGQVSGSFTSMAGSSAMLLFNKKFAIGVTAQQSVDVNFSPTNLSPLKVSAGFGGLKMEYTVNPNSALHVSFPLVVGAGVVRADSTLYRSGKNDNRDYRGGSFNTNSNSFVVVQPGIQLEGNLFRYAKIFAGVNYRLGFEQESNNAKIAKTAMSGLSANVGMKLGLFDFKIRPKKEKVS